MVSIIIPTYNRANLLSRAIGSVLAQTFSDWELLIIDDGSTDNTKEIVDEFIKKNSRIQYFYKENGGQGSARNLGIKKSKGDYIAFLDSDDEWKLEKLQKQIFFLTQHLQIDFCYTADEIVLEDNSVTVKRYNNLSQKALSFSKLAGIGVSVPSSHIYKKESFLKVGFFNEDRRLIGLEDNEWSLRGFFLQGGYVDEPLVIYYRHSGQITKEKTKHYSIGLRYILKHNRAILIQHKKALFFRYLQLFYTRGKNLVPSFIRRILYKTVLDSI